MPPSSTTPAESAPSELPIFYTRPELLTAERHAAKSLALVLDHRFTAATNSVPLNGVEFAAALHRYPLVFSDGAVPFPMAILGLRSMENLFLGANGVWEQGSYIPAYVRRYPFVFMSAPDQKQFALCIDAASPFFVDGTANPFFVDGKPTEITKMAMSFCTSFQAEYDRTRAFATALADHDLLELKTAEIEAANGRKFVFGPFRIVDETKLGSLPHALLADWVRNGWLGWIYAHLFSFANWTGLARRLGSAP